MAQGFAESSNTIVNDKIALLARLLGSEQQACRLLGDYGGSLSALVLKAAANTAAYANPALATVRAAREVVQRALCEELVQRAILTAPGQVRDYLRLKLAGRPYEVFMVLFLDSQQQLIAADEMFRGTLNETSVYPREIVKAALSYNCASVILAHNHVSQGQARPSNADVLLTQKLQQALALVDVKVLDHFITGSASEPVFSFAESGLL